MSNHPTDREHKTRWRMPAVAAAAIVVLGVGAIAFAVSNTNADDPDGVPQAPAPTAAPTTAAPTTTVAPLIVTVHGDPRRPDHLHPAGRLGRTRGGRRIRSVRGILDGELRDVANVYADGCEHTLLDPPLGPTVDDLANGVGHSCPASPRRHPSTSPSTGTPANRSTSPSPITRPWPIRSPARTRPTVSTASSPSGTKGRRPRPELLGPGPGATAPTVDPRRRRHPTRDRRTVRFRLDAGEARRHGRIPRLHPDRLTRSRVRRHSVDLAVAVLATAPGLRVGSRSGLGRIPHGIRPRLRGPATVRRRKPFEAARRRRESDGKLAGPESADEQLPGRLTIVRRRCGAGRRSVPRPSDRSRRRARLPVRARWVGVPA